MPFDLPTAEEKPVYVRGMFDRISGAYDRVNDLMTAGRHRAWKRTVIELARVKPGSHCLDVCTGTGDLAFLHAQASWPGGSVTALDFSPGMLEQAKARPWDGPAITWMQGDAMALPFRDALFDVVSIAFGIRNVADPAAAVGEFARVLRPGGRLVILEFDRPANPLMRWFNDLYCARIMPITATLISGDRSGAYRYLPASVGTFMRRAELVELMESRGFRGVSARPLTFGICVCYRGVKG